MIHSCTTSQETEASAFPEITNAVNYLRDKTTSVVSLKRHLMETGLGKCFTSAKPLFKSENK